MLLDATRWAAACAILPTVTAFYPYDPSSGSGSNSPIRRASNVHGDDTIIGADTRRSVTFPLRRVPVHPRKNGFSIVKSNDPRAKNSVAVDQDGFDLSYMVAVTIGSSPQEYYMLLDSAASNTWVMASTCNTDACGKHNLFGEGHSTSLKTQDTPFSVTYGTGTVSGTVAKDIFHVGSVSTTLTFGLSNNVSSEFVSYPMDGILGLGKGDGGEDEIDAPQLIETLASEGLIPAKLYGLYLSRGSDGLNDGELNMGEVNKDRFEGDMNWLDNVENKQGFWEVKLGDAGADDKMVGYQDKTAIIDSGTSYMLIPEDDATALHKLIDGYTQSGETFTVPCSTKKELKMKFGSITYSIPAKDWVGQQASGAQCRSNIFGRQTFGENQWLVGDLFMKNVYTAFDLDNDKVGFGKPKSGNSSGNSSSSNSSSSSSTPTSTSPSSVPSSDMLLPVGSSPSGTPSNASDKPNTTSSSESSPPSPNKPDDGSKAASGSSVSTFALLVALGALSFMNMYM